MKACTRATYVSRVLRLTLLAPEIVEAILDGRQRVDMQLEYLLRGFPLEWAGSGRLDFSWSIPPVWRGGPEPSPPIDSQPVSDGPGLARQSYRHDIIISVAFGISPDCAHFNMSAAASGPHRCRRLNIVVPPENHAACARISLRETPPA
jgi:hypothetical protein